MENISTIEIRSPQLNFGFPKNISARITESCMYFYNLQQFAQTDDLDRIVSIQGNDDLLSSNVILTLDGEYGALSDEQARNFKQIDDIASLPDNWDENGASSFPVQMISKVKDIVYHLSIQPYVFPTANHSIQLEYEKEDGDYLEFELFEDDTVELFRYTPEKNAITDTITIQDIDKAVNRFYGRDI